MKQPRDYQQAAHDALIAYLHDPATFGKNPLVVEATGLGKSLNIAMFVWHMLSMYPHLRIMQLCHVKELVQGNYKELLGMWPAAPAGIYAAGLNSKDTRAQVTFAMINSVHRRPATFGHVDFVIIDEAHRMAPSSETMYGKFIGALRERNPNLVVVGYTATPYRMGQGSLTDEGGLFDEVVFDIGGGDSFLWAIEQGYLIRPVPVDPGFEFDDSSVSLAAGDFKDSDASAALHQQNIIERAVDYSCLIAREQGRQCNLVFAQSIEDCELIADMYSYKGYPTKAVHSKRDDRDEVLAEYAEGKLWGVVNKDIMTTGSNFPRIDMMTVLRLTRSPGLWVQMVGRTTRPVWLPGYDITTKEGRWQSILASHKQNALILDFVGNTERLGPINYPNLPRRRGSGGGDPPVRKCPQCQPTTLHHVSTKTCPHCGYEWPVEEKVKGAASSKDIVLDLTKPLPPPPEPQVDIFGVHEMTAAHHEGKGDKLDTLRVMYRSGYQTFSTWVCIEHAPTSFPGRKAREWWNSHGGQQPFPLTVGEAVERSAELRKPLFIKVWVNTKYPEIQGYDFEGTRFVIDLTGADKILHEPEPDPFEKDKQKNEYARTVLKSERAGYFDDDEIPF